MLSIVWYKFNACANSNVLYEMLKIGTSPTPHGVTPSDSPPNVPNSYLQWHNVTKAIAVLRTPYIDGSFPL